MPGSAHGKAARISAPILGVGLIGKARAHLAVEPMFAMLLVKTHYTARSDGADMAVCPDTKAFFLVLQQRWTVRPSTAP